MIYKRCAPDVQVTFLYILDICHSLPLVAALSQVFPNLVGGVFLSLVTNGTRQ
jgi:hypothetical protein